MAPVSPIPRASANRIPAPGRQRKVRNLRLALALLASAVRGAQPAFASTSSTADHQPPALSEAPVPFAMARPGAQSRPGSFSLRPHPLRLRPVGTVAGPALKARTEETVSGEVRHYCQDSGKCYVTGAYAPYGSNRSVPNGVSAALPESKQP